MKKLNFYFLSPKQVWDRADPRQSAALQLHAVARRQLLSAAAALTSARYDRSLSPLSLSLSHSLTHSLTTKSPVF